MTETGAGAGDESDRIHDGLLSETAKIEPEKHEAKVSLPFTNYLVLY
jgi:hypothetical protein